MAVVINFGSEISYLVFGRNKISEHIKVGNCDRALLESDRLKDILSDLIETRPEILSEPVYVTLTSGSGVVFKTFATAQESVMVNGSRTGTAEMQAEAREVMKNKLPFGLEGDYVSTIMTEYKSDTDYILSCAYFPASVLGNIRKCFGELGISLLDVYPMVYGIYKALDTERFSQIILDVGDEMILVNSLGIIVWAKPKNFVPGIAEQYLTTQSETFYSVDPKVANTEVVDRFKIDSYLFSGLAGESGGHMVFVSALGLLGKRGRKKAKKASAETAASISEEKKGGMNGVIAKLRLLFKSEGKE